MKKYIFLFVIVCFLACEQVVDNSVQKTVSGVITCLPSPAKETPPMPSLTWAIVDLDSTYYIHNAIVEGDSIDLCGHQYAENDSITAEGMVTAMMDIYKNPFCEIQINHVK